MLSVFSNALKENIRLKCSATYDHSYANETLNENNVHVEKYFVSEE